MAFALSLSKRDLSQNNAVIYEGTLKSTDFESSQECRQYMFTFLREWHSGEGYTKEQLDLDARVFAVFFRGHTGDILEYQTKDKPNIVYTIIKSGDKTAMDDPSLDVDRIALQTTKKIHKHVSTAVSGYFQHIERIYTYETANAEINPLTKTLRLDPMLAAFFNSPNIVAVREERIMTPLTRVFTIAPAEITLEGAPQK